MAVLAEGPGLRKGTRFMEPAREISVVEDVDVVVAGGGPAGIGAAIAAARNGARTLIVEQFGCLGGMATSGLHAHMNQLNSAGGGEDFILGGIPLELCQRIEMLGTGRINKGMLDFEVESMKRLLDEIMVEAEVKILYHTFVSDAILKEDSICGIVVENKGGRSAIAAKVVIDTTGDADVAARAGVEFEFGRPSDGKTQPVTLMFRIGGCDTKRVEEFRREQGDPKLRALWKRAIEAGDMPPFQTEVMGFWYCHIRPDQIGVNFTNLTGVDATNPWDLSRAEIEGRKQAEITLKVMRKYIPGCENAYIIDTAQVIGVRETRRIVGEYTLTLDDILSLSKFEDGVAKGSFFVDIHNPEGTGLFEPKWLPKGTHYDIPYRCLVPKKVDNLLVAGRCISVTHEALGSTRVMFQCMALGQAAGTAAALCIKKGITPREVEVAELRQTLREQGCVL